jgi:hypothetical protein
MRKDTVIIETPTITAEELIKRFLGVIEEEARSNPRFRQALIGVLCQVAVAVPGRKDAADLWRILGEVPW